MSFASNGDVELCFDTIGEPGGPVLLLVAGLGMQLIAWREEWCRAFADRGWQVIRFDNRDAGLSTKLTGVEVDLPAVLAAWAGNGEMPAVPYRLAHLADDAFAVLDEVGVERANVLGMSLGGMIAQTMAITRPERVSTLTSIMSTTGEPAYYQSVPEVRARLLAPRPADREEAIEFEVALWRTMCGPRFYDEGGSRALLTAAYDRCWYPEGMVRQTAAIRSSGSRDAALRELAVPTLVIHGTDDPLILPNAGEHTAEVIPRARLVLVEGMGHDLPAGVWPSVIPEVIAHVEGGTAS